MQGFMGQTGLSFFVAWVVATVVMGTELGAAEKGCPRWISVMPLNADNIASVSEDAAMLGDETIVDGIA